MREKILSFTAFIMILLSGLTLFSSIIDAQTKRGTYTTTADVLLRAGPGTNHPVITTLPKGIKINVVGKEGDWLRVESKHGGKPGYIEERFARLQAPAKSAASKPASAKSVAGPYKTLKDVDLREGPGTKYKVVTRLPAGLKVNVVRTEGDWLRVESKKGAKPGYLEKKSVERWKDK
jgi:uncharacterized protein YraI